MRNKNENYDITEIVVEKAIKIMLIVCRINGVTCDRISFSFRRFERRFIQRWKDLMYKEFPYDYNSRMSKSTDVCPRKIRDICNKM